MNIFEFDKDNRFDLLDRRKTVEVDRSGDWHRRPSRAPMIAEPIKPAVTTPERHSHSPARNHAKSLKLHILDLGKLRLDKNFIVANSTFATAKNPNPRGQVIDIPVSAYYIEHPDGNVLYDTGCHPDWSGPDARWPDVVQDLFPVIGGEECTLPARLDALGLGPDQFKHVVLSHLHCDHAGCVEYFRKSQVIVHEDEFAGAFRQYALRDHTPPYIWKDLDKMARSDLHWRQIGRQEPDQNIAEGVRLLNFGPGHAYGMLGLHVSLRSQADVILVSDACYTAENYGPPMKPSGIGYDSLGSAKTIQRIRILANDTKSDVWFGHDANQFASLRKSDEGFFYE